MSGYRAKQGGVGTRRRESEWVIHHECALARNSCDRDEGIYAHRDKQVKVYATRNPRHCIVEYKRALVVDGAHGGKGALVDEVGHVHVRNIVAFAAVVVHRVVTVVLTMQN
jgi:hypothetical protein